MDKKEVDALRQLIKHSKRAVVFTGAGISTESGIPDFRSPGGVWDKYQPIHFQDFIASAEMRRESWRRKLKLDELIGHAEPNSGHKAVAELVATGKVACVITQNIDGLHQQAGVPDEQVIELHGNTTYAACLDCGKRYELQQVYIIFQQDESLPHCDDCQGIIKTATISFGQAMPETEMQRAHQETLACDLFIAMGSSLVVFPAAGFPQLAVRNGARLVIINREPTDMDEMADLVLHTDIGPILQQAVVDV